MQDSRFELAKTIDLFSPADGIHETLIPGVHCIKFSHPNRPTKMYWRAALGVVAQGCKEIALDGDVYRYDAAHYIATPIGLPVTSRIFAASPEKPFLCLVIDFNPTVLSEVAALMKSEAAAAVQDPQRAIFINKASVQMLAAATRLGNFLGAPEDAVVLGPLVIKEIFYYLLKGDDGAAIRQFVSANSKTHRISAAIYTIKSELSRDVDVAALANGANMSRSAFFKYFKEITALSPIQYQKRLRLLEAKRLMIEEDETAESSAFKVGYNSASQFSREYSRMFGCSPLRDALKSKQNGNSVR